MYATVFLVPAYPLGICLREILGVLRGEQRYSLVIPVSRFQIAFEELINQEVCQRGFREGIAWQSFS
jgi:hypothetical protein